MILYLDTSALVKRYFAESFSQQVIDKWNESEVIVTSSVAYAETMSTIYRKQKDENLDDEVVQDIVGLFQTDWTSFIRVDVADHLNALIDRLVHAYFLRGFDTVHLASALLVHDRLSHHFFFACFDQRLNQAARIEGLATF